MGFNGDLYPTAGATSVMSTKGDVVRYDSQRERYGIGSTNQVLQVSSGGLPAWQTLASAGATAEIDNATITSNVTSTATTLTDIAGLAITIGNITDGQTFITASLTVSIDEIRNVEMALADDDTTINSTWIGTEINHANAQYSFNTSYATSANGSEIQMQAEMSGGTLTIIGKDGTGPTSSIVSLSVG